MPRVNCPYCCKSAKFSPTSGHIYNGRDYGPIWWCGPCDARVGCHRGTKTPLGSLANAATRDARQRAHAAFDPRWRSGAQTRRAAYAWLAEQLGMTSKECHIGKFTIEQARRVVELCRTVPSVIGGKKVYR